MRSFAPLIAAALVSRVSGHAFFQQAHINGKALGAEFGIREPPNNSPVEDVTSNDMICNVSPSAAADVIDVVAGDTITTEWRHTLSGPNPSDSDDPIAASHKGPIMAYLAKVDDATTSSIAGLKWFKIYEDGFDGTSWAVDKMIANDGLVDIKLPSCIPDGQYLFRAELLALHSAYNYPGAQFYMECAQINVSGGSGSLPTNTVAIPGLYSGTDPGVKVDIYSGLTDYTIPGPEVFTCGAGSAPVVSAPAATSAAAPATTSAPVVPEATAPAATTPAATSAVGVPTTAAPSTPTYTPVPEYPEEEEEDDYCEEEEPAPVVKRTSLFVPPAAVERRVPSGFLTVRRAAPTASL